LPPQVEFYFSDANITKDKFLLKHVKRNKEGFVSLKLISSFKRVKHLTKDWRQVFMQRPRSNLTR
jgi:la-related protein 6